MPLRGVTAAYVAAVAAGIVWLWLAGAPQTYALVNGAATIVGLVAAVILRRVPARALELFGLVLAALAMAAAIMVGPGVDGVHRWLEIGPLRLHTAALFGPLFLIAYLRRADWTGTAAALVVAALAALQPDMSFALALVLSISLALFFDFRPLRLVALAGSAGALLFTANRPDGLQPVPFVENVLQDALSSGGLPAILLPAALAVAIAAPLFLPVERRAEGAAVSGWFLALTAASLLAPFPTPLIGYGAAPIIGYGIAIGLLGHMPAAGSKRI
ncbi:hypothetical protein OKA06_07355 [Novosphingobium sp. MW5]|nr:hypothetical protein [Novosphingobium sp. MW5]